MAQTPTTVTVLRLTAEDESLLVWLAQVLEKSRSDVLRQALRDEYTTVINSMEAERSR